MTGLYGLPSADHVLVVHRGEGLVVDASDPAAPAVGVGWAIHQVVPVHEPALVLLVGFTEITALDAQGVRWTTPRLCLDDLLVERVADDHIVCSGEFPPRQTLVVSLTSGERLSGPAFRW